MASSVAVLVAAGGASRRFGSDKLALLLDRTLASLPTSVGTVVCVGPRRPTPTRPDVVWTREAPPGGGPLPAVAAGLGVLRSNAGSHPDVVVVIGGDMPSVGRAVDALVAAIDVGAGAAVLVSDGYPQPLASAWQPSALVAALERARASAPDAGGLDGVPLRRLLDGAGAAEVVDTWGAGSDVDVPDDLLP